MEEVTGGADINETVVEKLLKLDALVYPFEHQGELQDVWARYEQNKDTYIISIAEGDPVGYMCVFPVQDHFYDKIKKEGLLNDSIIRPEHIQKYYPGNVFNLYLISIVIHPEYQGTKTLKYLLQGFADSIERLKEQGIQFNSILANAVTAKGHRLLHSLGFQAVYKINEESTMMEAKIEQVTHIIKTRLKNES